MSDPSAPQPTRPPSVPPLDISNQLNAADTLHQHSSSAAPQKRCSTSRVGTFLRLFCKLACIYVGIAAMLTLSIGIVYFVLYSEWSQDKLRPGFRRSILLDAPLLEAYFSMDADTVSPAARTGFSSSIVAIAHYLDNAAVSVWSLLHDRGIATSEAAPLLDERQLGRTVDSALDTLFGSANGLVYPARIVIEVKTQDVPYLVVFLLFVNVLATKLLVIAMQILNSGGRLDNAHPRVYYEKQLSSGLGARAVGSHMNSIEALGFFGLGLLVALQAKADAIFLAETSLLVFASRVLYHIFYILDLRLLRSYVFFIGYVATAMLFAVPVASCAHLRYAGYQLKTNEYY